MRLFTRVSVCSIDHRAVGRLQRYSCRRSLICVMSSSAFKQRARQAHCVFVHSPRAVRNMFIQSFYE